jgi:hypothetical protein
MHLYCMCQILVFNAINTIVTDFALHISNYYINMYMTTYVSLKIHYYEKHSRLGLFTCTTRLLTPLYVSQINYGILFDSR